MSLEHLLLSRNPSINALKRLCCRLLLRYGADASHAVPATDSGTVVQCSRCGRTQASTLNPTH